MIHYHRLGQGREEWISQHCKHVFIMISSGIMYVFDFVVSGKVASLDLAAVCLWCQHLDHRLQSLTLHIRSTAVPLHQIRPSQWDEPALKVGQMVRSDELVHPWLQLEKLSLKLVRANFRQKLKKHQNICFSQLFSQASWSLVDLLFVFQHYQQHIVAQEGQGLLLLYLLSCLLLHRFVSLYICESTVE